MIEDPDWEAILRRDGPAVYRTAWRVLGRTGEADDCFQETFVAALEYARAGKTVQHWRALLQRIVTTRAIDRLRRRAVQLNRETAFEHAADDHPSPARLPHEQLQSRELAARLRRAMAKLPDGQAEAFCLFHLEDWSYREIAESLSISSDLVGVWLQRAKAKLRELLADVDPKTALVKEVDHE